MADDLQVATAASRIRLSARIRAAVYDAAIVGMTAGWYRAVLERVPTGARMLDIGIGTGAALVANTDILLARELRVCGVDVDADYVARCRAEVARRGLSERIEVRQESIDDHRGGPYDAAYFSGSFMLLPDPTAALRHVATQIAVGAPIFFTQTFEHARAPLLERLKPLLRWLTTIDFGRVTYEPDFLRAVASGGLAIDSIEVLAAGRRRSSVLVTAVRQPLQ